MLCDYIVRLACQASTIEVFNVLAAFSGFELARIELITAIPSAPADMVDFAFVGFIPPMASKGHVTCFDISVTIERPMVFTPGLEDVGNMVPSII